MAKDQYSNKTHKHGYRMLIVARQGEFASGLGVLLSSTPQLGPIRFAEDQTGIEQVMRTSPPTFVILDEEHLGSSLTTIIEMLSKNTIKPRIIVMGSGERNNLNHAKADAYILKGTRSDELLASIQSLLPEPGQ